MEETSLPETQLRSWRPRRPSAALETRIFSTVHEARATSRWLWGALTPTAVCLLMTLIMLNSSNTVIPQKPVLSMILSNDGGVFGAKGGSGCAENQLASVTFDWTNHTVFNSSMGFTPTTNLSN